MNKQKIMKAWAVTSEGYEIPITSCDVVRSVKSTSGFEFEPWAVFTTKKQAIEIKKQAMKIGKFGCKKLKIKEIEIKIKEKIVGEVRK